MLVVVAFMRFNTDKVNQKPAATGAATTQTENTSSAIDANEALNAGVERGFHPKNSNTEEEKNSSLNAERMESAESGSNEDEGTGDEEAEDEASYVKRTHLIGGADVVWEPPKPKDSEDKFGEPPE